MRRTKTMQREKENHDPRFLLSKLNANTLALINIFAKVIKKFHKLNINSALYFIEKNIKILYQCITAQNSRSRFYNNKSFLIYLFI